MARKRLAITLALAASFVPVASVASPHYQDWFEQRNCAGSFRSMNRPHQDIGNGNILYPDNGHIMSGPLLSEDEWMSQCLADWQSRRSGWFGHFIPGEED